MKIEVEKPEETLERILQQFRGEKRVSEKNSTKNLRKNIVRLEQINATQVIESREIVEFGGSTGLILNKEGYILCTYHGIENFLQNLGKEYTIEDMPYIVSISRNHSPIQIGVLRHDSWFFYDERKDLALVPSTLCYKGDRSFNVGALDLLRKGTEIKILAPKEEEDLDGRIYNVSRHGIYLVPGQDIGGKSGSPMVNEKGELLGVVVSGGTIKINRDKPKSIWYKILDRKGKEKVDRIVDKILAEIEEGWISGKNIHAIYTFLSKVKERIAVRNYDPRIV